jgi:site-specific DNA-methyltransferase (adenine-specific)
VPGGEGEGNSEMHRLPLACSEMPGVEEERMKPYYEDKWGVIYCGDCREILPELPKVDLVLTDPPYGVGLAEWDRYITQDELDMLRTKAGAVAMFGAATPRCIATMVALRPMCDRVYVWHNTFTLTHSDGAFWQWSPIYTWGKPFVGLGRDVLIFPARDSRRLHPAQKPSKLMTTLVGASEGTILDPFMGSGTTLFAAKSLNRKSIGIEIDPKYCDIAVKRLRQEVFDFRKSNGE